MLDSRFVILAFFINLCGSWTYISQTLKGKVRPNRVSWFMWTLAPMIAFAAEISQGVGIQALQAFSSGFIPLLIFTASFYSHKAAWKITRFDIVCGALSCLGLLLWLITRHGNVAIFFSIVSDAFAAIPTIVKSWHHPETEGSIAFGAAAISALITLLTIDNFTFANAAFPAYILTICIVLFVIIQFKIGSYFSLKSKRST